jgi:hypothetical protein
MEYPDFLVAHHTRVAGAHFVQTEISYTAKKEKNDIHPPTFGRLKVRGVAE